MKICYLAPANSVHTMKWVKHFANNGNEVVLISFAEPIWDIKGLKFHKLKRYTHSRIDLLLNIPRVRRIVKEESPDILHSHYATDHGFLGAMSGFHPFIVSVWGSDIYITPGRSIFHRKLVEFNLSRADEICSTSRAMAEETGKYIRKNVSISVTPFGVDTDIFKPMKTLKNINEVVIGTVKALEKNKGLGTDQLIEVFADIAGKYGQVKLKVVGDGNHRFELEELAVSLGIAEKVEFMGRIAHSEMPRFMSGLDIFCCLSRSGKESFGVAPVEASSCGVPVVASRAGGLPEVIMDKSTGLLVGSNRRDEVYDALTKLIRDPDLRRKMGENGTRFVKKNYEWQDNAGSMETIYRRHYDPSNAK